MTVLVEAGREAALQDAMRRHPAGKQKFPNGPGDQEILDTAYANMSQHINTLMEAAQGSSPEERWWNLLQYINHQLDPERLSPYLAAAIVRIAR